MNCKIAVVVPAKGGCIYLERCLQSLINLDYPSFEVIIVDDGLDESRLRILNYFKDKIKLLKSYFRGPSFARNLALQHTDAEFIAFTDSDCIVDENWLKELYKGFKVYPGVAACGGIQKLPKDATRFEKVVFLFMKKVGFITDYMKKVSRTEIREVNHNPSCNVMYKKDTLLKEGGFLEGLWPGEDVELDYRLRKKGHKIVLNPKAIVYHYPPANLKSFLKMMYRYGGSQGFLVARYGIFRKMHSIPFLSIMIIFTIVYSVIFKFLGKLILFYFLILVFLFTFNILSLIFGVLGFIWWNVGFWREFIIRGLIKKS